MCQDQNHSVLQTYAKRCPFKICQNIYHFLLLLRFLHFLTKIAPTISIFTTFPFLKFKLFLHAFLPSTLLFRVIIRFCCFSMFLSHFGILFRLDVFFSQSLIGKMDPSNDVDVTNLFPFEEGGLSSGISRLRQFDFKAARRRSGED